MEDWAEIRRLHRAEGVPIKEIARRLGVARNTVRAALSSDRPPKYRRAARGVGGRSVRAADPGAAAGVADDAGAGDRASGSGGRYSDGPLKKLLARIRPEYVGIDPVDRVIYEPGQLTQCDLWFPEPRIPVGPGQLRVLPVLVMTLAFSRFTGRDDDPVAAGRRHPVRHVDADLPDRPGAPRRCCGTGSPRSAAPAGSACRRRRSPAPWPRRSGWPRPGIRSSRGWSSATTASWRPRSCPAARFASPADFNDQLGEWLARANTRTVRSIQGRPVDLLEADYRSMLPLPPVAPPIGLDPAGPAGPRLLRASGHSGLLRRPAVHRPVRRRHRLPARGDGVSATGSSPPATTAPGPNTAWSPTRPTAPPPPDAPSPGPATPQPSGSHPPARRRPRRHAAGTAGLRRPVRRRLHPPHQESEERVSTATKATPAASAPKDGHAVDDRLPDPGAEDAHHRRVLGRARRPGPRRELVARGIPGRRCCNARSPTASPRAPSCASAPPTSRP